MLAWQEGALPLEPLRQPFSIYLEYIPFLINFITFTKKKKKKKKTL
jgi:hypothetical protein